MNTTVTRQRGANHVLHAVLSVITFGLWLPVWAVAAAVGRRETVTTHGWVAPNLHQVPPYQQQYPGQLFHQYPEIQQVQDHVRHAWPIDRNDPWMK